MLHIGKILAPVDFSEVSALSSQYALELARIFQAEILFLHVIPELSLAARLFFHQRVRTEEGPEIVDEEKRKAHARFDVFLDNLPAQGIQYKCLVEKGEPFLKILQAAESLKPDLVVQGLHGTTGLERAILGGTAERVIRHTQCPVLTVKPHRKMEKVEKRFRRVYRKLSALDLQRISDENQAVIDEDLLRDPMGIKKSALFLNYYSPEGLVTALEEYGIYDLLKKKGFDDFVLSVKVDDVYRHCARVYWGGVEDPSHLLIELILREGTIRSARDGKAQDGVAAGQHSLLIIEWLCLQNPSVCFSPDRPPLPGQTHPGLGIGYEILGLLILMAKRTRKDGLLNRPQFYHNARVYHERFKFFDPVREGRLLALMRDTGDDPLTDVSWAIHHGCLRDASAGEKVVWEGGEQTYPLSPKLQDYFASRRYRDIVWETAANTRYRIDWEKFAECVQENAACAGVVR